MGKKKQQTIKILSRMGQISKIIIIITTTKKKPKKKKEKKKKKENEYTF